LGGRTSRFDGGHGTDEWNRSARSCGNTKVDAVLQAMTTRSGCWLSVNSPITASTRSINLASPWRP
jgi:hypothetical protein